MKLGKVGRMICYQICRGSIKWLWLECDKNTDEPENESFYNVWFSNLALMKNHTALQAQSSIIIANREPTVIYVKIEYPEQRKVSGESVI